MALLQHPKLGSLALRLALVLPLLVIAAQRGGEAYGRFWLPWYQTVLRGALPDYRVASLTVARHHDEWQIAARVLAAEFPNLTPRLLDHLIWSCQRARPASKFCAAASRAVAKVAG